jgi:hypothetical protein
LSRNSFHPLSGGEIVRIAMGTLFVLLLASGCLGNEGSTMKSATVSCPTISGTSWVPNVTGASDSNHDDASVQILKASQTKSVALVGLEQPFSTASATSFTIDMSTDLSSDGSLSLAAEVQGLPSGWYGGAWPLLVSLVDSNGKEWVNLAGCSSTGLYDCSGSSCVANTACTIDSAGTKGSAYLGASAADRRSKWEESQRIGDSGNNSSINIFPTCNWSTGSPTCYFNTAGSSGDTLDGAYFSSGKLPTGTYTAKYLLLASNYTGRNNSGNFVSLGSANLKVTAVRKVDSDLGSSKGALDLNVILVGSKNIEASHTDKGKQNLDALFSLVQDNYAVQNSGTTDIQLGKITVYEWDCQNGGDSWASVNVDDVGSMFAAGSKLVDSASEGKALNIFLVSTIDYDGTGTVLGISGGIGGAMVNGTHASGLVFSSMNLLSDFNPGCDGTGVCALGSQESDFINMGATITHEMGHYLGLNHVSELTGTIHDRVPDTPSCTTTDANCNMGTEDDPIACITRTSCRSESACNTVCSASGMDAGTCASESDCQFNHVMWWTTKHYNAGGSGDGNLFSSQSAAIINYNPFVQ